ncbi:hypothetical protein ACYDMH_07410 [Pectobacterium brasiliense]
MQGNRHGFFSVSGVIFVFVSPDGSLSRHRSGQQGAEYVPFTLAGRVVLGND